MASTDIAGEKFSSGTQEGRYGSLAKFAAAVDLLLACVYSPSLQHLVAVLQDLEFQDLELWIEYNSHQVLPLCELVLKGIEYDLHALDILNSLAVHKTARDIILEVKPQFLQGLIKASLVNERAFQKYSASIVALLSTPLEGNHIMPVEFHQYLTMLSRAVIEDHATSLALFERILRNNPKYCTDYLGQTQRYDLTSSLASRLGSTESDQVLTALSCLASFATGEIVRSNAREVLNTQSLFDAEKGLKVLRLVMGTVNSQLSCATSAPGTITPDFEPLMLRNILRPISAHTVSDWLSTKEGGLMLKRILEKLESQVSTQVIHNVIRILAHIFGLKAGFNSDIRAAATNICRRALSRLAKANVNMPLVQALCGALPLSDSQIIHDSGIYKSLLTDISIEKGNESMSWDLRAQRVGYMHLLRQLREMPECHARLAKDLASADGKELVAMVLTQTNTATFMASPCRYVIELKINLYEFFLGLQLNPEILADHKQTLENSLGMLQKLLVLGTIRTPLLRAPPLLRSDMAFFQETVNTPYSGSGSQDWKIRLLNDLQIESQHQHASIVSRMDMVCRDMERRAETNEEPLRVAQNSLLAAQTHNAELQTKLIEATGELQQRDVENLHVFEERQRLEGVISGLLSENEHSSMRIRCLEESEMHRQRELVQLREHKACAEQKYRTEYEQRYVLLETEMTTIQQELAQIHDSAATLQAELSKQEELLKNEKVLNRNLQRDVEQQRVETQDWIDKCAGQTSMLNQVLQESDATKQELSRRLGLEVSAHSELQDLVLSLRQDLEASTKQEDSLRCEIEQTKSLADEKMVMMQENHASQLKSLEDQLTLTLERSNQAVEKLQAEKCSLKQAYEKTKASHEKHREEFKKAQELSKRLMTVMGVKPSPTSPALARRSSLIESDNCPPQRTAKRPKARPSDTIRRSMQEFTEADLTMDMSEILEDKENDPPNPSQHHAFASEDSAILSELSGLGI